MDQPSATHKTERYRTLSDTFSGASHLMEDADDRIFPSQSARCDKLGQPSAADVGAVDCRKRARGSNFGFHRRHDGFSCWIAQCMVLDSKP